MGETRGGERPAFQLTERLGSKTRDMDGASATGGRVWGTYIHGVFDSPAFRRHFINRLRAEKGMKPVAAAASIDLESDLDRLADRARAALDVDAILETVMSRKWTS